MDSSANRISQRVTVTPGIVAELYVITEAFNWQEKDSLGS